jgi:HEAT repeat protein/transglutaminase-like putative cysteine protease
MPLIRALGLLAWLALAWLPARVGAQVEAMDFFRAHDRGSVHIPMVRVMADGLGAVRTLMSELDAAPHPGAILEALGFTRAVEVRPFLLERLRDPRTLDTGRARQIRRAALAALLKFTPDEEVVRAVAASLADEDSQVRASAAEALASMAHPASLPSLLEHTRARLGKDKIPLLWTLVRVGTPEALAAARGVLEREAPYLPWFGALALEAARLGRQELFPTLLARLEAVCGRPGGCSVDDDALWALGLFRDARAAPLLRKLVLRETFRKQFWAAVALGELGDASALPELQAASQAVKEWPASPAWENQAALAWARARLGDRQAETFLEGLAQREDPESSMLGLVFLLKLRGKAHAAPILEKLRLYKDVREGCPRRWPVEFIVESLFELHDPEMDLGLVEASAWPHGCNAAFYIRKVALQRAPERWREALVRVACRGELTAINHAFRELGNLPGDLVPQLERMLSAGSPPSQVLALRQLGLRDHARHRTAFEAARRSPAWQVALEASWLLEHEGSGRVFPAAEAALPESEFGPRVAYGMLPPGGPTARGTNPVERAVVRRLAYLPDGRLAAAAERLLTYDGLVWTSVGEEGGLCSDVSYDLLVAGARVWVAGQGGVAEGDGKSFRCHPLEGRRVLRLAAQGTRLWLGTDQGLFVLEPGRPILAVPGSPVDPTVALVAEPKGPVWLATWQRELDGSSLGSVELPPRVFRLEDGRLRPVAEPFEHYFATMQLANREFVGRAPVRVYDLALDPAGRLLAATDFGVLRLDGERSRNLSGQGGNRPWRAARAVAVDGAGRVFAFLGGRLEVLEGERWRQAAFLEPGVELLRLPGVDVRGALLLDRDGAWLATGLRDACVKLARPPAQDPGLGELSAFQHLAVSNSPSGQCSLVRWLDRNPARQKLAPDTLVAAVYAGGHMERNPETDLSPPDRARRFRGGQAVRVPANVLTIAAVAKDPWDYGPVEFRFKFDEGGWSAWSDKNALLTPNILDEGVHRVLVQSRDRDGQVDPTPAELRFTVFTKEMTIIKIHDGELERVFPSQYLRYQRDGLGRVLLENLLDQPLSLDLEFKVEDLFERPARSSVTLPARAKEWVAVPAPFSDAILKNTTQRTAQAVLEVRFVHEEVDRSSRRSFGLELMEARAFVWDRPARLASFIHTHDPAIDRLGAEVHRALSARHPAETRVAHPLRNHLTAMYAFEALRALGVGYRPDPVRPFAGLAGGVVDTVMFPAQTLGSRAGDCDDLVVLTAALLENLGVPVALAPVRGHIYLLYDTGVRVENRHRFPVDERRAVSWDGRLWVPLETTVLGKGQGFEAAWLAGAEAHHGKYKPRLEELVVVRAAWAESPPALLALEKAELPAPDLGVASASAEALLKTYQERLLAEAPSGQDRPALLARGEALVKGGQFADAVRAYRRALELGEDAAALYGLGTALAGQGDMLQALVGFQRALELARERQQRFRCLLALAQCHKVNGSLAKSRKHLEEALALNPTARFDGRYADLIAFVLEEDKTRAAGEDESAPFLQVLLLP